MSNFIYVKQYKACYSEVLIWWLFDKFDVPDLLITEKSNFQSILFHMHTHAVWYVELFVKCNKMWTFLMWIMQIELFSLMFIMLCTIRTVQSK